MSLLFCKLVYAFTGAGIIPSQYLHLSIFAGLGTVGYAYIRKGIILLKYKSKFTANAILVVVHSKLLGGNAAST